MPNLSLADDHADAFMDSYILRGRTRLMVTFDLMDGLVPANSDSLPQPLDP